MLRLRSYLRFPSNICHEVRKSTFSTVSRRCAEEVRIVEVGPRDGLQNEKRSISLETKIELLNRLSQTGLRNIEGGSFVAPKWVPQMANSADVLNHILGRPPSSSIPIAYNFLVPNLKGLENFLRVIKESHSQKADPISTPSFENDASSQIPPMSSKAKSAAAAPAASSADLSKSPSHQKVAKTSEEVANSSDASFSTEISVFTAASEAFSQANTNCSIAESLERCKPIILLAKSQDIRVRGYVSVALGCPYEGPHVPPAKVAEITTTLLELGVDEVSIGDTTGMGTAPRTQDLLKVLFSSGISHKDLALHFHDTYGQALVNAMVGLEHGIRTFDCSVGGLGGCPYSKGATGNIATEDLVYCFHSLGAQTGIDLEKIAEIGAWISAELGKPNDSRAGKAILSSKAI